MKIPEGGGKMSNRTKKWCVGILAFLLMWWYWGFDETANIVNNIGWFGMVAAWIAWTETKETRDEAARLRERIHTMTEELHKHHIGKE